MTEDRYAVFAGKRIRLSPFHQSAEKREKQRRHIDEYQRARGQPTAAALRGAHGALKKAARPARQRTKRLTPMKKPLKRLSTKCYENAMEMLDEVSIHHSFDSSGRLEIDTSSAWDSVLATVKECSKSTRTGRKLFALRGYPKTPYKMVSAKCSSAIIDSVILARGALKAAAIHPDRFDITHTREAAKAALSEDTENFGDSLDLALQNCETERKNYLWKEYNKEVPLY